MGFGIITQTEASMIEQFARTLRLSDLSDNTIASYCKAVEYFYRQYGEVTKKNLLSYKGWLVENYKAKTVNSGVESLSRFHQKAESQNEIHQGPAGEFP